MAYDSDSLDAILALIRQLESALLGFKRLRSYIGSDEARQELEQLIKEFGANLAEVKRRLVQ